LYLQQQYADTRNNPSGSRQNYQHERGVGGGVKMP